MKIIVKCYIKGTDTTQTEMVFDSKEAPVKTVQTLEIHTKNKIFTLEYDAEENVGTASLIQK